MLYIRKAAIAFFTILLCVLLCACTETNTEIIHSETASEAVNESINESANDSVIPDVSYPNRTENIIITTDKTEYSLNDIVILEIRSEDENEFFEFKNGEHYGFRVQYYDPDSNEWISFPADVEEPAIEGAINTYTIEFVLSQRAEAGKSKYRIVHYFNWGTFYSNEFTIK